MTRQEVKRFMAVIRAAYPSFYKDADPGTLRAATELWAKSLAPLSYADAGRALEVLLRQNPYPPTVADVWKAAQQVRSTLRLRRAPVFRLPEKGDEHGTEERH
ncbi:replicative helicase loader/inhibitor [uncultured Ruthenibacterium sp.]|uniref:replicative helicase loader/inhibitor n=1 Tax=uncultured Ruthenibacterium sp. TaxID=1905347 RepID=UPI00349EE8B1